MCCSHLSLSDGGEESYSKLTLGTAQQVYAGEAKVLGVRWNPSTDRLVFDFSDVASQMIDLEPTKRNIVGVASRFYDPIGFVLPVTICFKMLFQARQRSTGTAHSHWSCCPSGNPLFPACGKLSLQAFPGATSMVSLCQCPPAAFRDFAMPLSQHMLL